MNKALILVDFQNEWTDKKSDYYVSNLFDLINKNNKLIKYCRDNNFKIIFTRHIDKDSDESFAPNSENIEIFKEIEKNESDTVIDKNKISPFYQTNLEAELEGIEKIVVTGILTNLCVRSLIQDAYDRDFDITVVKDCCVAFDQETQDFTFQDLKATREEINFVNLNDFLTVSINLLK